MRLWLWMLLLMVLVLWSAVRGRQIDEDDDDEEENDVDDDNADDDAEPVEISSNVKKNVDRQNPCVNKTCRRGEMCIVDRKFRARCVCYSQCLPGIPGDDRYQVCSKRNVTYESMCALDRDHCLCRRQLEGCSDPAFRKIRMDYFGPCQQLTPCSEREFKEFPGRTRQWLYVIMKELAGRAKIPEYQDLVDRAEQDASHSHAVLWKFCDLDVFPHDRVVNRRELLYTIQTLKPLEHCLIPFLDSCDADSNGQITLREWGTCLGVENDKIKDVCKAVRGSAKEDNKATI